ncbi:hypothetical protein KFE25_009265 [Diacronema lutheri]|uniref:Nudix hydrolase domain-containing protein n=2 Tax=Diacronema lutheri TaxID=2081491 RepID=A0A8J6CFM0_DIALT|nr:hypothetical protein KFE25_009265 [Diacronema lutheri]
MAAVSVAMREWRLLFTLRDLATPASARGLSRAAVRVETGTLYARAPHSTDAAIADVWASRLSANARLFDAPKYRLASVAAAEGACVLRIGLTGYREYIGTHLSPEFSTLVADGERESAAGRGDASMHLSCALGVETVLLTSDGYVVLLRRSRAVATSAGEYNGPSGHPEPEHAVGGLDAGADAIADQLWAAVLAETVEETNVPSDTLSAPVLIGAMVDERRKPDLLFCTSTTLSSAEVLARYRAGAPDAWESSGMIAVPPVPARAGVATRSWDCDAFGVRLTAVTQAAMHCMAIREQLLADAARS